jgi:hypothetical protein
VSSMLHHIRSNELQGLLTSKGLACHVVQLVRLSRIYQ